MARDLGEARAEITRKKARIEDLELAGRGQDNPASIVLSCKSARVAFSPKVVNALCEGK